MGVVTTSPRRPSPITATIPMGSGARSLSLVKRVVVDHFGGPDVLTVVEDEVPQPGAGEVRVRVLASGVSFTDALIRAGTYLGGPKPPFTPGYELVGVVEKLGPRCSRLREGDRIGALTGVGRQRGARLRAGEVRGRG